jgi:putative inorganic carbon (HCO3(-)) transporter
MGAIYDKNIIRARVYGVAAVLFLLTGLFTSSLVPIIGTGAVFAAAAVIVAANRLKGGETAFKGGLYTTPELRYAVLAGSLLGVFALVYLTQGIFIRDRAIAFSDAFYRLYIIGNPNPENEQPLYEIAWVRSLEFIKLHPLTGVGPDCFSYVQMSDRKLIINSIDKSYNEYFFIAVTRGIPSLLAYLALLYYALRKGCADMKNFFKSGENWFIPAIFTAVAAYLIAGLWSASAITVAPFFWLLLGFMCAKQIKENEYDPI